MPTDDITPLAPGSPAPDFTLTNILADESITLSALRGQIVIVNFWSGECAWSRGYDQYFNERRGGWLDQGIVLLHVNSNVNEEPIDTEEAATEYGVDGPILDDAGNVAADAYGATTTPHVFVVDPDGLIAYQGAVDDRTFRQREPTINYLDAAIDALSNGGYPDPAETPAYGCTIVRHFD